MDDPIDAPPLNWFFRDASRRRAAWRYWGNDVAWGMFYSVSHHALRLTSIDACSAVGDFYGGLARRFGGLETGGVRRYRGHEVRARENWRRLRPQDSAAVVDKAIDAAYRHAWRTYSEYSVLERLWPSGRIAVSGAEHIAAARAARRPTLIAGLHLGNWEAIGPTLLGLGYAATGPYQRPPNRFDHRMVVGARLRYGGKAISPGRGGGRTAYRLLAEAEQMVLIYIDELINKHLYAPFFGRPAKLEGNIAYVARMGAMSDAAVIPTYCLRLDGANFRMTFLPPVTLTRTGDREADLIANVTKLNAVIEPVILAHLDQWLWLFDLQIDGVAKMRG